jgi:hypothetical protein
VIFTCHPALPADGRVALAPRVLCGLSIPRIAAVMVSTEPATAKRLTRARTKVAAARIPYRVPARTDAAGGLVTLDAQDRAGWDAALTAEGLALLADSPRRTGGVADPYQLQAAIAAEHARAPSYELTDWAEVVRLYDCSCRSRRAGPWRSRARSRWPSRPARRPRCPLWTRWSRGRGGTRCGPSCWRGWGAPRGDRGGGRVAGRRPGERAGAAIPAAAAGVLDRAGFGRRTQLVAFG